jgi:hypothetical protein
MMDKDTEPIIDDTTEQGRNFMRLAIALGGLQMIEGLDRIMDGLCPDCGTDDHDISVRCVKYAEGKAK